MGCDNRLRPQPAASTGWRNGDQRLATRGGSNQRSEEGLALRWKGIADRLATAQEKDQAQPRSRAPRL